MPTRRQLCFGNWSSRVALNNQLAEATNCLRHRLQQLNSTPVSIWKIFGHKASKLFELGKELGSFQQERSSHGLVDHPLSPFGRREHTTDGHKRAVYRQIAMTI